MPFARWIKIRREDSEFLTAIVNMKCRPRCSRVCIDGYKGSWLRTCMVFNSQVIVFPELHGFKPVNLPISTYRQVRYQKWVCSVVYCSNWRSGQLWIYKSRVPGYAQLWVRMSHICSMQCKTHWQDWNQPTIDDVHWQTPTTSQMFNAV